MGILKMATSLLALCFTLLFYSWDDVAALTRPVTGLVGRTVTIRVNNGEKRASTWRSPIELEVPGIVNNRLSICG